MPTTLVKCVNDTLNMTFFILSISFQTMEDFRLFNFSLWCIFFLTFYKFTLDYNGWIHSVCTVASFIGDLFAHFILYCYLLLFYLNIKVIWYTGEINVLWFYNKYCVRVIPLHWFVCILYFPVVNLFKWQFHLYI